MVFLSAILNQVNLLISFSLFCLEIGFSLRNKSNQLFTFTVLKPYKSYVPFSVAQLRGATRTESHP